MSAIVKEYEGNGFRILLQKLKRQFGYSIMIQRDKNSKRYFLGYISDPHKAEIFAKEELERRNNEN